MVVRMRKNTNISSFFCCFFVLTFLKLSRKSSTGLVPKSIALPIQGIGLPMLGGIPFGASKVLWIILYSLLFGKIKHKLRGTYIIEDVDQN